MQLPLPDPIAPMLAKSVPAVPDADAVESGYVYEPKWDGFRCIVLKDGDQVELASRGQKPLTRYFPEVVAACREQLPQVCALDGEIVVRWGEPGQQRLDWERLSQRIHPAESRITKLSVEWPAEIVCFDLLVDTDRTALLDTPLRERRARLEQMFEGIDPASGLHLTRTTTDADLARDWFTRFEGAGLDGVVAKPLDGTYQPDKRVMLKIKHKRTAEAVVIGYRVHRTGQGVGSLLLGMFTDDGQLYPVGGIGAFSNAVRASLIDELEPLVQRDAGGIVRPAATATSRFSGGKDPSFVPLEPRLVVEIEFDQLEGHRFRHAAQFLRWRPDRDPESCLISQVDRAIAYDLGEVLAD